MSCVSSAYRLKHTLTLLWYCSYQRWFFIIKTFTNRAQTQTLENRLGDLVGWCYKALQTSSESDVNTMLLVQRISGKQRPVCGAE